MSATTPGLVCAHHHLYSTLARGMPAPPQTPNSFKSILEQVWWRLDAALDLDTLYWSAALGAAEAVSSGTTAIIDHHESPFAIEGSLDAIKAGCDLVGVRTSLCYGVTDRWSNDGHLVDVSPDSSMTEGARKGLAENARFLSNGGRGMVGVHAAFTCSNDTLEAAAELATTHGVGVHIHVAEGPDDVEAGSRLESLSQDNWLLVHAVHLDRPLKGTVAHNPRSNMNNAVGYARPEHFANTVVLGTDGIGADMMDEARLAYVRHREDDVTATPETSWRWLMNGHALFPETLHDKVTWSYDNIESPWHCAFTTGIKAIDVEIDGRMIVRDGKPNTFDMREIRAKAAEASARLHDKLR